jgi:hypothetical protein
MLILFFLCCTKANLPFCYFSTKLANNLKLVLIYQNNYIDLKKLRILKHKSNIYRNFLFLCQKIYQRALQLTTT